jgi:hypothetical protein
LPGKFSKLSAPSSASCNSRRCAAAKSERGGVADEVLDPVA